MRSASLLLATALFAVPAAAAQTVMDYSQCVALARSNPGLAERAAQAWGKAGGGAAAMHCTALALTAMGRYSEAARTLDSLARNREIVSSAERAQILDQAGNAWLLAGQGYNAVTSFSLALEATPNDIGLLADRARARAMVKDWNGADADLSAALLQDQNRTDLLVLRSSARWALGRKAEAATDIVRALAIYPDYPPALVERGTMRYSAGDKAGARADWKKAADSGQGEAAADAKRKLAALDAETKADH